MVPWSTGANSSIQVSISASSLTEARSAERYSSFTVLTVSRLFGSIKTEVKSGGVEVSKAWQDPESAARAEREDSSGRVVAKMQVGGEWVVVTIPDQADEDKDSDPSSDFSDE
jgi:hypothetical protein